MQYIFTEKRTPDRVPSCRVLRSFPVLFLFTLLLLALTLPAAADDGVRTAYDITKDQFVQAVANVQETARRKGYVYGDSRSAVPTKDKKISCDRLVAKALYDLGFHDQETGGITCGTMPSYLRAHGFVESKSFGDIGYGSIVLIKHYGLNYWSHTFVTLSFDASSMTFDKYDCGSNSLIQMSQPVRNCSWYNTRWRTDDILVFNIPEHVTLKLDLTDAVMVTGQDFTITPTIRPEAAASKTVLWSSTNPAVATVSDGGVVKTLAPGETEIVARLQDMDLEQRCALTVLEIPVTRVRLKSGSSAQVGVGFTEKLVATVSPVDATYPQVTWSTLNPEIAAVSADGAVTGIRSGTATILARAGSKTAKCTVKVRRYKVISVALSKKSMKLRAGRTRTLKVKFTPSYADNQKVSWKSSNPRVARVKNGVVTALRPGTAVITVTAKDGKKKAACKLRVI